ncbi:MAG: hypothetical protein DME26_05855 [Verrucomicrobia bacterium]|nr:MAG: hypothetical protein DME26_05855 [Verrucomicrobiota bacterium]
MKQSHSLKLRFTQPEKPLIRKKWRSLWLASLALVLAMLGLTAQAQNPLTNGLVAYWNFDAKDYKDSIGTFDGTGNGTNPISFVAGKAGFGQAIQLDGTDQFVEITGRDATYDPDQLAFAGGSVSIAGWFKVGTFDKSWQALVAKGEGSNWRVARNGASPSMSYAGGLTDATGVTVVTDGNWHHFVAMSDAAGIAFGTALYIDGKLDATVSGQAVLAANGSNVKIGDNPGAGGRYWNGGNPGLVWRGDRRSARYVVERISRDGHDNSAAGQRHRPGGYPSAVLGSNVLHGQDPAELPMAKERDEYSQRQRFLLQDPRSAS